MNAHVTTDATESQPANPLTIVALQNEAALRALQAAGPQRTAAAVAHISGQNPKNMARQLELMARDNLVVQAEAGWTITPAGERALAAMDLAAGRDAVRVGSGGQSPTSAAHSNDVLSLRHDQIRPNPLNLRKDGQSADIESLADSIEAAGDVLQNLVVFPADGDGIHTLSAGERRWRAVGLLIEQGRWPADRRLRAIERENTAGQTSFIALVENGQRQNLSLIEEARGYQALVEETGWSARQAAMKTGRDPRTVQEMLKVLREADPADVARHEADPRDLTWEALRDSVKAGREPVQADIEDVAGGGGEGLSAHERESRARIRAELPTLNAKQLLALVELADKIAREPAGERTTRVGDHYPDPTGTAQALVMKAGAMFSGFAAHGGCTARLNPFAIEWLADIGLLTANGDRQTILGQVRAKAFGMEKAAAGALSGRYFTPWINTDHRAAQPAPPPPPMPMGGAGYSAIPTPKADGPLRALDPVETLAMVELAFLLQNGANITDRDGAPMVPVHQYWLDATASELRALGLVVFVHNVPGASRPYAGMPKAGQDWISERFPEGVSAQDLQALEVTLDDPRLDDRLNKAGDEEGFVTPWLNIPNQRPLLAEPDPPEGDDSLPLETPADDAEEEEEDDAAEAQALLAEISEQLLSADDFDRAAVFRRLGITFPLQAMPNAGVGMITDANGLAVFTVDHEGALPDPAAAARVLALVTTLNAAVAQDERPLVEAALPDPDKPAVPIRRSIMPSEITCLEDGRTFSTGLRAHLRAAYGLTPDAYRLRWGLPADYPMVAPNAGKGRQDAGGRLWSW